LEISVVCLPYNVEGKGTSGGSGPQALVAGGLLDEIRNQGHIVAGIHTVSMGEAEEKQYGGWNRVGLAGKHLCSLVGTLRKDDHFVLGLLADCNGVLGMLGGLQNPAGSDDPVRVGLVYIDAHGDYNTPETSPSGMLGGMPVAVAAGKALHRLRLQNGLRYPLQSPDIKMVGMRDLDDLEREAIVGDGLEIIREKDLIEKNAEIARIMDKLSAREDVIYIHIDLDILDPSVAPAAGLPSSGGLTGKQLGEALKMMMAYPKVKALAAVSYRADADHDKATMKEVMQVILGGTAGLAK
jgi:arginase